MQTLYDISVPLRNGMPFWPGDKTPAFTQYCSIADGDRVNCTHLSIPAHLGTHVDAPCHFVQDAGSIEQLPLDVLIGPARVVAIDPQVDAISRQVLIDAGIEVTPRMLFRTRNSRNWSEHPHSFQKDYVSFTGDAAQYLLENGVRLVGIDYLSIDLFENDGAPVHNCWLPAGVIALEGIDLSAVPPGDYELLCLPIKIVGSDGAPARAVLRTMG